MGKLAKLTLTIIAMPILAYSALYLYNRSLGPERWLEQDTLSALKREMKDPASTIILERYIIKKSNGYGGEDLSLCGLVDGKNSFGGYTGGIRFAARASTGTGSTYNFYGVELEDRAVKADATKLGVLSPFEDVYWNDRCVDELHPPIQPEPV